MIWEDFVTDCRRTMPEGRSKATDIDEFSLGLLAEGGELFDLVKKHVYHGHEMDVWQLTVEAGDVLFYLVSLCDRVGLGPLKIVPPDLPCGLSGLPRKFFINAIQLAEEANANDLHVHPESAFWFACNALSTVWQVCLYFGVTMEQVMAANTAKRRERYPNGFSSHASINRIV